MSEFEMHTPESVPEAAKDTLNKVEKALGMGLVQSGVTVRKGSQCRRLR